MKSFYHGTATQCIFITLFITPDGPLRFKERLEVYPHVTGSEV